MTTPPTAPGSTKSPLYLLVEAKLRAGSLSEYLLEARKAGNGFSKIAFELTRRTGVALTHEVVRRWVRGLEEEQGLEPSVLPGHEHHSLAAFEEPAA